MAPAAQITAESRAEAGKMTKIQKLAALLIILGPEGAARILGTLDEREVEAVSTEMARTLFVEADLQAEILREFSEVALSAGTSLRGGVSFTRAALEKALGSKKASHVISRVTPTRPATGFMRQIVELEPREISNLLKNEQPQTIALVTSYLVPEKASQFLRTLRPELKESVVERLATLGPTPIEVVDRVAEVIAQKMSGNSARLVNQTGGVKSAADLLKALDREDGRNLLAAIEERNPELGKLIRQKMLLFEDLGLLEAASLQKLLREVDTRDLAVALKNATDSLKKSLLGCISKRAAETVNEEMGFMGSLKLREIEAAQMRIIEVVRRLEGEGEIDLSEIDQKANNDALV
jgi:flagellar motor switch protein FliG